jgi:hypothetical protein
MRHSPASSWSSSKTFASTCARRLTEHAGRRLHRSVRRWLARRRARWSFAADGLCRQQWQQLEAALGEVPRLAAAVLGLPGAAAADVLPRWPGLDLDFEPTLLPALGRDISLPQCLAPVPARLARAGLMRWAERAHARMIESLEGQLLTVVKNGVTTALDKAWDTVNARGAQRLVRRIPRDARTCRVCRLLRDTERSCVAELVTLIAEPSGRAAYTRTEGVCLPHLALVVAATDPESGAFMLNEVAGRFEEVAEDMQAFAMKSEALRRGLHTEDEADAFWRAITHIAGARGTSASWPDDRLTP